MSFLYAIFLVALADPEPADTVLWRPGDGAVLVAFLLESKVLLAQSMPGGVIRLWDSGIAAEVSRLPGHRAEVIPG
jgi:hypothetical protein